MFLGSLVVSRFLSLVAHFVVTVIIFLSKVCDISLYRIEVLPVFLLQC